MSMSERLACRWVIVPSTFTLKIFVQRLFEGSLRAVHPTK